MQQARKGSQLLNIYRRHWLVGIAIAGILSCYAMLGLNQSVQAKPNLSSGNGSSAVQHQYGIAVDCVFCHVNSDGGADDTDFNIYGADLHNWFKGLSPRDTHSPRLLANLVAALQAADGNDPDKDHFVNGEEIPVNKDPKDPNSMPAIALDLHSPSTTSQYVARGNQARFDFTVTNPSDGRSQITMQHVGLDGIPGCTPPPPNSELAIGASHTFTCRPTAGMNNETFTVQAKGSSRGGATLPSIPTVQVEMIVMSLAFDVTPSKTSVDETNKELTLTYTIINDGGVPLEVKISNSDPQVIASCGAEIDVGEIKNDRQPFTQICLVHNVTQHIENKVTLTGAVVRRAGEQVAMITQSRIVTVNSVGVKVALATDPIGAVLGEPHIYTVTVTNVSDARNTSDNLALSQVQIRAPQQPPCNQDFPQLLIGASESYTCTVIITTDNSNTFTNTVEATAVVANRNVTARHQVTVTVAPRNPKLEVDIVATTPSAAPGEQANFMITVVNAGNVHLSNVLVSVPRVPNSNCNQTLGVLGAGIRQQYSCHAPVIPELIEVKDGKTVFSNKVIVSGIQTYRTTETLTASKIADVFAGYLFMLPIIANLGSVPANQVDLKVKSITVRDEFVKVIIQNTGESPLTGVGYWVDLYISPTYPITHVNQIVADWGGKGLVWGVTADAKMLAPRGTANSELTLCLNDPYYAQKLSNYPDQIPAGSMIYVQVDSANKNTNYGNVLETDEIEGGPYNNIKAIKLSEPISTRRWKTVNGCNPLAAAASDALPLLPPRPDGQGAQGK